MKNGGPAFFTTCRHCAMTWPPPIPAPGQPLDAAYYQLAISICGHLQTHVKKLTPQEVADIEQFMFGAQMRFSHWFYLKYFDSNDPELARYRDVSRHAVWSMLRAVELSDAGLEAKVKSLDTIQQPHGFPTNVNDARPFMQCNWVRRDDALALLKAVRDTLEERAGYPEASGQGAPRVVLSS